MYKNFIAPESELTHYRQATVDGRTGVVVGQKGRFRVEQADEILYWLPEALGRALQKGSTAEFEEYTRIKYFELYSRKLHDFRPSLRSLDPEINYIYMLHPFGWLAFGHFFDSLQRLRYAIGKVPKPFKVIHSRASRIVDFHSHMEKFGVEPEQLEELGSEAVVVPNLWMSPWQGPPAQLSEENFQWIHQRYTENVTITEPQRLYLSRNHVQKGARGVKNEAEVCDYLKKNDFEILFGTESLNYIIDKFFNAEMIIGPHGSLLANTMFCNEKCRILEFCPDNRVDRSFQRKVKKPKDYRQILKSGDENFNIEIPIEDLRSFISCSS